MKVEECWVGERKHFALTILDGNTPITAYVTAVHPVGASLSTATWNASAEYGGKLGVWVQDLTVGVYRVLTRVGTAPDEVDVVEHGYVVVRDR
jgi:hypothetical protein